MINFQKKLNEKNIIILFFIFFLFLVHQIYYIFIGGTTWDEPASILSGVKQIQKIYLFFFDSSNLALQNIQLPEYYGGLVFIPAVVSNMSSKVLGLVAVLLSDVSTVNSSNELEIALIIRHILLNIYIVSILYLTYQKLSKLIGKNKTLVFLLFLLLIPSFNGHAMFNFADIPLAMQFLLSSILFLSYLNNRSNKAVLILGFVFGLTLLTRVNAVAFLGALSLFELLYVNSYNKEISGALIKDLIIKNSKIYTISLVTLVLGSPSSWKSIAEWFYGAYVYQFKHPQKAPTVLNGKLIIADEAPRTYLLEWLTYKLPVAFLVLVFVAISLQLFKKDFGNVVTKFSVFFLGYVNLAFLIYNPVAYDEIRHYLFLLPFLSILVTELIFYLSKESFVKSSVAILILLSYLVSTQYGLGAYKYVYLNEFVNKSTISVECEEYISQSGCGDWHTDYWGFGGKELVKLSEKYSHEIIYFCPPQFTYSLFQEKNRPWTLINGYFSFDDAYPFQQDHTYYYQSHMLEKINSSDFEQISFISLNYHRPPTDSCGLTKLDKNKFDIECNIIDGVKTSLRGKDIWINYLSRCSVSTKNL